MINWQSYCTRVKYPFTLFQAVVRPEWEQTTAMAVLGRRCIDGDGRPDEERRRDPSPERESDGKTRRHREGPVRRASGPWKARGIEAQGWKGEVLISGKNFWRSIARIIVNNESVPLALVQATPERTTGSPGLPSGLIVGSLTCWWTVRIFHLGEDKLKIVFYCYSWSSLFCVPNSNSSIWIYFWT